ncbi:MAG: anti-repressor protein [Campylobacterota bacterium]|nr:anti-repressor protein [Campylobacterota bacterium]
MTDLIKIEKTQGKKILGYMRDISGFEKVYAVTDDGNIWSYPKTREGFKHKGMWLARQIKKNGYVEIRLQKDGASKAYLVHRLVAIAFIDNPYNKHTVNHINGIKNDNRHTNLEWATHSENTKHSFDVIKTQSYERLKQIGNIGNQKRIVVTEELSKKVYNEYISIKTSFRKLATKYSIGKTTVERIVTGKGQMYFTNKLLDEVQNGRA